jgi:hypothetical protein
MNMSNARLNVEKCMSTEFLRARRVTLLFNLVGSFAVFALILLQYPRWGDPVINGGTF